MGNFNSLFEPFEVRRCTIPNRIVMTPMGTNFAESTGEMSFLHMDYYEQRAQGGAGLIIVENACVDFPSGSNGTSQLRLDKDIYIPRMFKLTETIHKHATKIAVQLNHAGASAVAERIEMQPVSASDLPNKKGGATPRPLTKDEIYSIVESYAKAAKRAQIAGFDAVEIHCGHSYLVSQFLSPLTNNRTDEFGGSAENRARFANLILKAVREQVGPFFPILVRISADEFVEGGSDLQDSLDLLQYYQEEADIIDVSCGLVDSIQYQIDANYLKDGWRTYLAKAVKEKFNKPVITVGNIRDPKVAEEILESGDADFIGLGRQFVADPQWPLKVKEGREDEIRKCISCNIGCSGHRIGLNRPIRCTVNPSVNEGEVYKFKKVNRPCNVVVIGGGTAGLEAACTAAEVGCMTFLIEKQDHLGGLSVEISKIPEKKRLRDFPDYLVKRASRLKNLIVFTNTEATIPFVEALKPDFIVNSTGSTPLLPPITGLRENIDHPQSSVQGILGMINNINNYPENLEGKKVVVVGGGAVGLDVVEFFSNRKATVSIVEMLPVVGKDLDFVTKIGTYAILEKNHVNVLTSTALQEVHPDHFIVKRNDQNEQLDFDYGFVCLGMRAYAPILNDLHEAFDDKDVEIINIGDSFRARRIIDGTAEGRNILNALKTKGYLE
jgi:2,4-dienoyl-CoA reductase-like NADH-dependent reductase (Old Yellow Enzyme family)/NADH dehydrogenase FAD-containing subunit